MKTLAEAIEIELKSLGKSKDIIKSLNLDGKCKAFNLKVK